MKTKTKPGCGHRAAPPAGGGWWPPWAVGAWGEDEEGTKQLRGEDEEGMKQLRL